MVFPAWTCGYKGSYNDGDYDEIDCKYTIYKPNDLLSDLEDFSEDMYVSNQLREPFI